jgi:carboxypeptidase family protein
MTLVTRIRTGIACLVLVQGLAGCGGSTSAVTAPNAMSVVTSTPPPAASVVAMKGTVSDGAFRAIAGARIEVLDGAQAGATTITDSRGEFSFWGTIEDNTRFRATSDGYSPSVKTLQPPCAACNPTRWVNFVLNAVTPSVDMAGDYTATFTGTCDNLPTDLRTRTYEATIGSGPYNGYVNVPLRGGTFVKGWDSLPMGVESDYVAFWIEILVEQIAPSTYLTVNALAAAHVGTHVKETYTFPLVGSISYCVTQDTAPYDDCYHKPVTYASCASGQLTLTRR